MEFKCKTFELNHSDSTMKVGTDSILLASFLHNFFTTKRQTYQIKNILDVGCGCGILSLCMAQIFPNTNILGIDIDRSSIRQTNDNFANSKYYQYLKARNISLQKLHYRTKEISAEFINNYPSLYDLIISNPPFFSNSLNCPEKKRNNARHDNCLSKQDFVNNTYDLISENGLIALILPENQTKELIYLYNEKNIYPQKVVNIFSKPYSPIIRQITIFSNKNIPHISIDNITIRANNNNYTPQYKELTSTFLL